MSARAIQAAYGFFRQPGKDGNPTTGQTITKNLRRRQSDYDRMINQKQIGDGHRGPEGYTKPGSLKK